MTQDHRAAFAQSFERWFKGNQNAIRFCTDMLEVAHVWDDLVDGDKPVLPEAADAAFRKLMFEIPVNDFYRVNFNFLHPVMVMVWAQWSAANRMEAQKQKNDMEKAYMLRASLYQLFHACAVLCGGLDWAADMGPEIYRLYGETLENVNA